MKNKTELLHANSFATFSCFPAQPLKRVICVSYFHFFAYPFYLTHSTNSTMMALTIDHDITEPRRYFRIQLTAASDTIDNSLPFITPSSIFQDFITHLLCFINSPGFLPTFLDTLSQSLVLACCSLPRLSLLDFLKSMLSHLLVPGCNYYAYADDCQIYNPTYIS